MSWKVTVPEGKLGNFAVEKFSVSKDEASLSFVTGRGRGVPAGDYTKLVTGNCFGGLVMSDTPDERRDHSMMISHSHGHILINGLGLGCVLQCCLEKECVERATVIELSEDVLALVAPHYREKYGDRIEIIQADAFEYKPPKNVRYGAVWHDIWNDMCEDNLPEMHRLHRKYGRRADWQGSWGRAYIEQEKRRTADAFWRR